MVSIEFSLNALEYAKAGDFIRVHEERHGRSKAADGARYTYEFTPSGLGTSVWIRCNCGERVDATDYSEW